MTEHLQVQGRRLGRRPTDRARLARTIRMADVLTDAAFEPPPSVDYAGRVPRWLLGRNDRYGTCGPTSVANLALLVSTWLADAPVQFTDEEILDLYRRSGNPDFDPATGAGDNGVDMTVMLSELVRNGIGFGDRNVKALAYGVIDPHDTRVLWTAGTLFGAVLWGMDLDVTQSDQFDHQQSWDYVPGGSPWGGHAVLASPAYDDEPGTQADRTTLVTWATVTAATDGFIAHQVEECYLVIFPWHVANRRFYDAVDWDRLGAIYQSLTGRPFPRVAPPEPAPTPTPAPVQGTVPAPTPEEAAALADWRDAPHWWRKATKAAKALRAWQARWPR